LSNEERKKKEEINEKGIMKRKVKRVRRLKKNDDSEEYREGKLKEEPKGE